MLYSARAGKEPSGNVQLFASIDSIIMGSGIYGEVYDIAILASLTLLSVGYFCRSVALMVAECSATHRIIYAGRFLKRQAILAVDLLLSILFYGCLGLAYLRYQSRLWLRDNFQMEYNVYQDMTN